MRVEDDTTPPEPVTGLQVDSYRGTGNTIAELSWNPSIDNRSDAIDSYEIEYWDPTTLNWDSAGSTSGNWGDPDSTTWSYYQNNTPTEQVRVTACDFNNNCSHPTEITVVWP